MVATAVGPKVRAFAGAVGVKLCPSPLPTEVSVIAVPAVAFAREDASWMVKSLTLMT